MRKYQEIVPIARSEAETIIRHGPPDAIALALVQLAYYDPDSQWVENICIRLSSHEDKWVRRACATCLGHLARIHGKIDREKVMPMLNRLLTDPDTKGEAEDALSDFQVFLR